MFREKTPGQVAARSQPTTARTRNSKETRPASPRPKAVSPSRGVHKRESTRNERLGPFVEEIIPELLDIPIFGAKMTVKQFMGTPCKSCKRFSEFKNPNNSRGNEGIFDGS